MGGALGRGGAWLVEAGLRQTRGRRPGGAEPYLLGAGPGFCKDKDREKSSTAWGIGEELIHGRGGPIREKQKGRGRA